uniref:Large ribosomal subunit protein uL16m n=1 Tax=Nephroselmis olivacea TaxID=31312 RepID=Q9TCB1_NEPOL|nr:ribosomal protein L16 [Nephroselmis olivacea]AAF03186.1 ribosomal protein L16 [Nephroselmis olivacea]
MLSPRRTKFRKFQKGKAKGIRQNQTGLKFGQYGIQALETGRISASVIEAARRTMTRIFRRSGRIWIRIFPDIAVSQKPAEVRMGKGKGAPSFWVCRVQRGQLLFEIDGVSPLVANQAASILSYKFPIQIQFVNITQFYNKN